MSDITYDKLQAALKVFEDYGVPDNENTVVHADEVISEMTKDYNDIQEQIKILQNQLLEVQDQRRWIANRNANDQIFLDDKEFYIKCKIEYLLKELN